jgi:hypothetical protein
MHNTEINYEGGLEKLATDLAHLRYDALEEFLDKLANELYADSIADYVRERYLLASSLLAASNALRVAKENISKAWEISKPHMQ